MEDLLDVESGRSFFTDRKHEKNILSVIKAQKSTRKRTVRKRKCCPRYNA